MPTNAASPMLLSGNSAARPAALLEEPEPPEPDALEEVGDGVKPMGPVWVVAAVAALDAEDALRRFNFSSENKFITGK